MILFFSQQPLAKFRHAAARVQFMCRVQINLNRYATEAGKGAFAAGITDMVNKLSKGQQVVYVQENETSKETITFNAGDYKTNHEVRNSGSFFVSIFISSVTSDY